MVRDGCSTVPRQIGGVDFESGECDFLECAYRWVSGQKHMYSHQNEYYWKRIHLHRRQVLSKRHPYYPLTASLKRFVYTGAPERKSKIIDSEPVWMICQDSRSCKVKAAVSDDRYNLHHAQCGPGCVLGPIDSRSLH